MKYIKKIYHYLIALLSYIYYGRPSRKMIVIGVTGTKGKSTTCSYISSVLRAGGKKVAVLSTVEFRIGDKRELNTKKMTMLGRGKIHKFLEEAVKQGCQYVIVETSSEGILQYRHKFLNYDIGIFTNLGTEHQERHGGFENLKHDKAKMFSEISKHKKKIDGKKIEKIIIVNGDDDNHEYFLNFKADEKYIFGIGNLERFSEKEFNIVMGENIGDRNGGNSFQVDGIKFKPQILGDFNIYNALASICVGKTQGILDEEIKKGVEDVKLVEGRMEFIDEGQDFKVVVDFAHEPMSYKELFTSLKKIALPIGGAIEGAKPKLIGIVGSDGGGRDIGKRKEMGSIAGEFCDIVIVTDVNCYDEDPEEIAEMLALGARESGKKDGENLFIEIDRKKAIKLAFEKAQAGDVVAITAKGTEPCIAIEKGKTIPWDDREIAKEVLKSL